jgi:tRNA (adenine57-N1/adenine58-N1)-methyltransferase|tara:strand:- start:411 stop:1190 length:780 start_codon:yes stop_codon:yes gene_type:complete
MNLDNRVVVVKSDKNKFLAVVEKGKEFVTNEGKIQFDNLETLPSKLTSSSGFEFKIYSPTYKEFVLLMKRGPQIIYPKDLGQIIVEADISSNSTVLEIGTGSGALTLFLFKILKDNGNLYTLDISKQNQRRAQKTISRFFNQTSSENDLKSVNYINSDIEDFNFGDISEHVDSIITDIPEPWLFFLNNEINKNINWVSYLPNLTQVQKIINTLSDNGFENLEVKEIILRDWVVDDKKLRPSNKMISHTGFLVSGQKIIF